MTQGTLDITNVHALLHQVGGKAVAQSMWGTPRISIGFLYRLSVNVLDALGRILTAVLPFKKPVPQPALYMLVRCLVRCLVPSCSYGGLYGILLPCLN